MVSSTHEKASQLPVTPAPAADSVLLVSQGTHPQADTNIHIHILKMNEILNLHFVSAAASHRTENYHKFKVDFELGT